MAFLSSALRNEQTRLLFNVHGNRYSTRALVAGIQIGLLAAVLIAINNLRDLDQDLLVNKRTLAVRLGDRTRYAALVHEFHDTIIAGADNRKLAEHYERLMNQLAYHRLVLKSVDQPGRLGFSLHEHDRIIAAIEARDHVGAEHMMRQHVEASSAAVLRALADEIAADETTS